MVVRRGAEIVTNRRPALSLTWLGLPIPAQALSMDHLTSSLQLGLEALVAVKDRLHLGPLLRCGLVDVDEQYVAHDSFLPSCRRRPPKIEIHR